MDFALSSAALLNVMSPTVLAFGLGILAVVLRSDLKLPEALTQGLSIYLLFAIGLKGGVGLHASNGQDIVGALSAALVLGILIPVAAFATLRMITRLNPIDRGSVAAHYGSTSLVTFTAALVFLQSMGLEQPGYAATMLTVLEIPGIVVGIFLAQRSLSRQVRWTGTLHEILTGKSIVLLVGGLIIGAAVGPSGYEPIVPLFSNLFTGALVLFLLGLGLEVGSRLSTVKSAGPGLVVFGVVFPLLAGTAGVAAGSIVGLGLGGAMILGVLCASASYIAAPAAVTFSLPQANLAVALTASIVITFPFNLVIGIPYFAWLAGMWSS